MSALPERKQQIVEFHATLIRRVVQACWHPELRPQLEPALEQSVTNGWTGLVSALRRILDGGRDPALLNGLDDEDATIVEAVLRGLQNPETLPRAEGGDASMAASGLAGLIHAAGSGDAQALQLVAGMAGQMSGAGGAMAELAALVRPLVNGERDPERLFAARAFSADTQDLVLAILGELARLDPQ